MNELTDTQLMSKFSERAYQFQRDFALDHGLISQNEYREAVEGDYGIDITAAIQERHNPAVLVDIDGGES